MDRLTVQTTAVLFDFNGVLVDDEHLHFAGFNAVLAPYQLAMTEHEYNERYLGFDDRGVFQTRFRDGGQTLSNTLLQELITAKGKVYFDLAKTKLTIFPGAAEVIAHVAARVPVGIVSGALRAEIDYALELMQVRSCVRFIVAAEDVQACKPDPAGYLQGIVELREHGWHGDKTTVVAVEDSLAGIASAQSAGIRTVAVAHTYPVEQLRTVGPTAMVLTLREVMNVLQFS